MKTKSIEQLEKDIWKQPIEFPSNMVEKCYHYRKISISELSNDKILQKNPTKNADRK